MDLLRDLQDNFVALSMVVTAITAFTIAWKQWIGPMAREVRDVLRKASRVFDMMLGEHQLMTHDGSTKSFDLPSAFVHLSEGQYEILKWQQQHDRRWPPDHDSDVALNGGSSGAGRAELRKQVP